MQNITSVLETYAIAGKKFQSYYHYNAISTETI